MEKKKVLLSTLWVFAVFNYLYCDIVSFMDSNLLSQYLTGTVNGMILSQGFLLGGSVLMEIPIAMVLLSRILGHSTNRWSNMIAALIMTLVQVLTLLTSKPTTYYVFFSIIEISCTVVIFIIALKWPKSNSTMK